MIKKEKRDMIEELIAAMTPEDLCGQLMNINVGAIKSAEELEEIVSKIRPGGLFFGQGLDKETIFKYSEIVNKYTKVPVIVSADIENGPGCCVKDAPFMPMPMAWGACDDPELVKQGGKITAEVCRQNGIHWSFAPLVDLNRNKDNPVVNVRAVSDKPEQVAKIAGAYVEGLQENGLMVAGCKHFPGDGLDDRNQHFCTTINHYSKEEWMATYGYIYKEMFKRGTGSVMVAHIGLPWAEDEIDPILGPKPATLSYNVMTKLLKEELGYGGCLISDAMSMVGTCVMCSPDRLSIEFIKNGGDMLLFPRPRDFYYLLDAVKNGELSLERVKDAVRRILLMKVQARLFEDQKELLANIKSSGNLEEVSQKIADKSITIIRNSQNLIPLSLKKGSKFLIINLQTDNEESSRWGYIRDIGILPEELKKRGYVVDVMSGYGMDHNELEKVKDNYDCMIITCRFNPFVYLGGTLRINWDNIMTFWRGVGVDHPCVIFASFGDPYKLYELPFLRTYVNAYSPTKETMRAFVSAILGEKPALGKSPVALKGYFNCEV